MKTKLLQTLSTYFEENVDGRAIAKRAVEVQARAEEAQRQTHAAERAALT